MGRGRLTMELIRNERARNTTFQKRRKGLKKKMYEFSTLCGVDACMIIYGPYQEDRPMELQTWPPNAYEVCRIINRYKSKVSEHGKRSYDLSDFFEDRMRKIEEEIEKVRRNNAEAKLAKWVDHINSLSLDQLGELLASIDRKVEVVKTWMEYLTKGSQRFIIEEVVAQGKIGCSHTQSSQTNSYYTEDYLLRNQSHSSVKPFDINAPIHYPSDQGPQMLHFNRNPKASPMMMMMMNDDNYTQFGGASSSTNDNNYTQFGGASSSNIQHTTPLQAPLYYDPSSGMLENMMYNNPRTSSMSYHFPSNMQPMHEAFVQGPVMPSASQMHGHQANNYYDFDDFQMMNKRARY